MHVQGDAAPRGAVSALIAEPDYFCSGDKNLNGGGSGVVAFYSFMCGNGNPSTEVWKKVSGAAERRETPFHLRTDLVMKGKLNVITE